MEWVTAAENSQHAVNELGKLKKISQENTQDVIDKFNNGKTLKAISQKYNVVPSTVGKLLKKHNISRIGHTLSEKDISDIRYIYKTKGYTLSKIYSIYDNISKKDIRKALGDNAIRGRKQRLTEKQKTNVIKEYSLGYSTRELGRKYNVSHVLIHKIVNI